MPRQSGGKNTYDNLALLCSTCHASYRGSRERQDAVRRRRDHWYQEVVRKQHNLVIHVEQVAHAHQYRVEPWHSHRDKRINEIDLIVSGFYAGLPTRVGFSVHAWPMVVPEWRVREVLRELMIVAEDANTALQSLVIVTGEGTRMQKVDGSLTHPLNHKSFGITWLASFRDRGMRPIRFETPAGLDRYFQHRR